MPWGPRRGRSPAERRHRTPTALCHQHQGSRAVPNPQVEGNASVVWVTTASLGLDDINIPLLGRIAAGASIETIENKEEINLAQLLNANDETYMLEVHGNSMIDAHIQSGDYVLVDRYKTPEIGDIVVAILENETATLKKFYPQEDGSYILQPANSSMEPIYCDTLEVRGVVSGVIRRY